MAGPWRAWIRRRRWPLVIVMVAIAALIAIIVGTVVGTRNNRHDDDPGAPSSVGVTPGQTVAIPAWKLRSTNGAGDDMAALSRSGLPKSGWHEVAVSKCTVMGCLLQNGVYNDKDLFFSENLKNVDASQFKDPWIYRSEFTLPANSMGAGRHFFLETNGITSRADVWLNSNQLANNTLQAGSYVGHRFDVTPYVLADRNAIAIKVYPTKYNYDFALGFVDWNPYPADNGTGVWRDVEIKQSGPAVLHDLRVATTVNSAQLQEPATVILRATAQNLENQPLTVILQAMVTSPNNGYIYTDAKTLTLGPLESTEVSFSFSIRDPKIWWPKLWGSQPLYSAQLVVMFNDTLSDSSSRSFGIRTVTSSLNSHNDTVFSVNGQPFHVVGGGYSADMFLRWDRAKFETQAKYIFDLGHNTVRLEGKQEHPELYDVADQMGLMVMAGWECCDKWEAFAHNRDLDLNPFPTWTDADYDIAGRSMRHEAMMMQSHPSMLAFLVGSDYWPDDRAARLYVDAMKAANWSVPIIASASKRGYPAILGPSGMKMEGPYDWVPPNYWYDVGDVNSTNTRSSRKGAAFGFGSELGAGVGTPEIGSLRRFLSSSDMQDLWKSPEKGLFHMSNEGSQFFDRSIYNYALAGRHGRPSSLEDYLLKCQILDYEATRAQFEAFAIRWSEPDGNRPATGLIYWMLNNAWPSLHWNLFDYYMHPGGAYFGAKTASGRVEHVAYDYVEKSVHIINRSLDRSGNRTIQVDVLDLNGQTVWNRTVTAETMPNTSKLVLSDVVLNRRNQRDDDNASGVVLLRLILSSPDQAQAQPLSRNVYWLPRAGDVDVLNWADSTWYHTPVTKYAELSPLHSALTNLSSSDFSVSAAVVNATTSTWSVTLENKSASAPAFFVRLNLVDSNGADVTPVIWSDNYLTLWPGETLTVQVDGVGGKVVEVSGGNVAASKVTLP